MSSKINIFEIVSGHYKTLREGGSRISWTDMVTFVGLPVAVSVISIFFGFEITKELSSLLVNFGSIFTALLLSVLVLVYDQESKLDHAHDGSKLQALKKELLRQLYYNISYSVLCSIALVILCFIQTVVIGKQSHWMMWGHSVTVRYDTDIISPVVVFITTTLLLNILMIVKRMHTLLVAQ